MSVVNQSMEATVLLDTIAQLQCSLEADNEGIKDYLFKIHSDLKQMPELLHILTAEQVHSLVAGIETINNVKIMEDAKPKVRKTKANESAQLGMALLEMGKLELY